jgi:hypothetical protein
VRFEQASAIATSVRSEVSAVQAQLSSTVKLLITDEITAVRGEFATVARSSVDTAPLVFAPTHMTILKPL